MTITGTITSTNTAFRSLDWWERDWWHTQTHTTTSYLWGTGSANATSLVTATYNGTATKAFTVTGTVTGTLSSTETATVFFDEGDWYSTRSKVGGHTGSPIPPP